MLLLNSVINLQELGARTLSTTGPAQLAAAAVANSTSRLAVTIPNRLTAHTTPTLPLVPNTLLVFDALLRLGVVRSGNGRMARSAPAPIPRDSGSNSVHNMNDDMAGDKSPSAAALGELLANAGVQEDKDLEMTRDAGPASRTAGRLLPESDESDEQDADNTNFDESSSASGDGRSTSYLEAATKKRTPTLVDSASQRRRIVSPRQVTAPTKGATVQSKPATQKRAAKAFYGEALRAKRSKPVPAAPENKKKERKSRKPPKKGLK